MNGVRIERGDEGRLPEWSLAGEEENRRDQQQRWPYNIIEVSVNPVNVIIIKR